MPLFNPDIANHIFRNADALIAISKNMVYNDTNLCEVWKLAKNLQISYKPLWKLMIDKDINKTMLKDIAGVSSSTVAKLGKNQPISMESMIKICSELECDISDIVQFVEVER